MMAYHGAEMLTLTKSAVWLVGIWRHLGVEVDFPKVHHRGDQIAFIGDKHHRPDGLRIDYGRPEEEFKVLSSLKPNQLLW